MEKHVRQSEVAKSHDAFLAKANQFRHLMSFVPDEKFDWKPSPSAKSPSEIMAHCALANFGLASLISGNSLGGVPEKPDEFFPWMFTVQMEMRTLEDCKALYEESVQVLSKSYLDLGHERLSELVDTPFGMPMLVQDLLEIPGMHLSGHSAQIDNLQTCWGDQDLHFLPTGAEPK